MRNERFSKGSIVLAQVILPLLLFLSCENQSYESHIDSCNKFLQINFDSIPGKELGSKLEQANIEFRECIIGKTFPHFEATSILGKQYGEDELKGKVIFLNFWFMGCPPCVAEIPILNTLNSDYADKDFVLLSFSTDEKELMTEFLEEYKIKYPVFADSKNRIREDFKFKIGLGFPTNIILNKDGKIIEFQSGGATDDAGLQKTLVEFKSIIDKELSR